MKDNISVAREAVAIRLQRSIFSGSFLLVEGSSDKTFYERFVDPLTCKLVTASGKPSSKLRVIEILSVLERDNFQGVLAIIDADFDHLLQTLSPNSPNLIRTCVHDSETLLIKSPALEKVIGEFGSEEKIIKFCQDVRLAILNAATSVGYLRWISQCEQLNLKFEGIKFSNFIDDKSLQIDELTMIQEVKNKSQSFSLQDQYILQKLKDKRNSTHDFWQVSCGHDLVEILSLGLRKAIGSAKATNVEPEYLECSLRLAYEKAYFFQTDMYLSLFRWQTINSPFKIF